MTNRNEITTLSIRGALIIAIFVGFFCFTGCMKQPERRSISVEERLALNEKQKVEKDAKLKWEKKRFRTVDGEKYILIKLPEWITIIDDKMYDLRKSEVQEAELLELIKEKNK